MPGSPASRLQHRSRRTGNLTKRREARMLAREPVVRRASGKPPGTIGRTCFTGTEPWAARCVQPGATWPCETWRWSMVIHWRRDAVAAMEEAKREQRWLLLDFSAAPM